MLPPTSKMFNPYQMYLERVGSAKECRYIHFRKPINIIGRLSSADCPLLTPKAKTVSRQHTKVEFKNHKMYITNLSATNPTFLNGDKVIRQTPVDVGDLVGFGSKPGIAYPDLTEDQIFIYEAKILSKSEEHRVIIVDDSEEEDIEIIEDQSLIQSASTKSIDLKNENSEIKVVPELGPEPTIAVEEPKSSIKSLEIPLNPPKSNRSMSLHIDTVESINDLNESASSSESSPEDDEDSSDNLIKVDDMLNVQIVLKKLSNDELEKWKPKIYEKMSESFESESEHEMPETEIKTEQEKILHEGKYVEHKEKLKEENSDCEKKKSFYNRPKFSKSKSENLAKSFEVLEKIRSVVDNDDSDDEKLNNIKAKEIKQQNDSKYEFKKQENSEKIQKSVPNYKRRLSTNERDSSSFAKKVKQEEPTTTKKMYKFPTLGGSRPSTSNNNEKFNEKDPAKRRLSLSENKRSRDSIDSNKAVSNNKMLQRRMSLCPTLPKIVSPHSKIKKKMPARRQTISESRYKEFDMFSKATEKRFEKYGPTGYSVDLLKKSDPVPSTAPKKPQNTVEQFRIDEKKVDQEKKKILDSILNPKKKPFEPVQQKNEAELDGIKKASLVKSKFTPVNRSECLTEAIPLKRNKLTPSRRLSTLNEQPPPPPQPQPSTSKDAISVAEFYDKYVKSNNVPAVSKEPSIDSVPEEILDSLNQKINIEMQKQHEQLAVETTLTINEPESPIESHSDDEELNLDTDDDFDKDDLTLGFYTLIDNDAQPNDIPTLSNDPNLESPMKNDPKGKTMWVASQQDEESTTTTTIERPYEMERFPSIPLYSSTIHVHHDKPVEGIKNILKTFSTSKENESKKKIKKVSFDEYNLVNIVRFGIDDMPMNTSKQQIAHVPPMRSTSRNPKYHESAACAEILEWDWKWITMNNELPENWKVEPNNHTYNSLQEYKNELKTFMKVELLKKLTSKYKTISTKENGREWNFMTVKDRKDDNQSNHIKLVVGCDSRDIKQGTLLLLKVRDTNSITRKPIDIHFFGYVTAVNDRGDLKLDTYCKELRKEKAVLKSTYLIHLRGDIKLFAVLNCIQDTPFMKLFLNPSLNKMERYEGMADFNFDYKITCIRLCAEQRTYIKKLTYECTKDDTEKIMFINGSAGTGKTYLMLAAVLNWKLTFRDKRQYLICTSTTSGIDEIGDMLYNMPHSSSLNIVRTGYRDQLIRSGCKFGINEQIQQKINNGVKGKGYKEMYKEIIENADIILSTLKNSYDLFDYQLDIDACFIDESNFAIDAELMTLVQLNIRKMIFIGDEFQLEPTQSLVYKETRCNKSYFNRVMSYFRSINFINTPVFTLYTQHRMNRDLFYMCNKHVYNDSLTYNSVIPMSNANFPFKPFAVFTLDETPNDQKIMMDEINFFCLKLCEILPKNVSIGIVNGFPSQRDKNRNKLGTHDRRIECLAVETIQGIEKDVIILTLRNTETYFMHNFNRISTALTRARKAVYVCSNMNMILYPNEAGVFLRLKDDARNQDLYHVIQKFDFNRLYSMLRK